MTTDADDGPFVSDDVWTLLTRFTVVQALLGHVHTAAAAAAAAEEQYRELTAVFI